MIGRRRRLGGGRRLISRRRGRLSFMAVWSGPACRRRAWLRLVLQGRLLRRLRRGVRRHLPRRRRWPMYRSGLRRLRWRRFVDRCGLRRLGRRGSVDRRRLRRMRWWRPVNGRGRRRLLLHGRGWLRLRNRRRSMRRRCAVRRRPLLSLFFLLLVGRRAAALRLRQHKRALRRGSLRRQRHQHRGDEQRAAGQPEWFGGQHESVLRRCGAEGKAQARRGTASSASEHQEQSSQIKAACSVQPEPGTGA